MLSPHSDSKRMSLSSSWGQHYPGEAEAFVTSSGLGLLPQPPSRRRRPDLTMPVCPMSMEFLKASHFALGPDPRLHDGTMQCTTHRDFQAYSSITPAGPSASPPRSTVFQREGRWATQTHISEMQRAFSLQPDDSLSREELRKSTKERAMQISNLRMHADTCPVVNLSTAQADYGWPELPPSARVDVRGARLIFDRDSVPSGDRQQLSIPPTTYQEHYLPNAAAPQARAPCSHVGERVPWSCCTQGHSGKPHKSSPLAPPPP